MPPGHRSSTHIHCHDSHAGPRSHPQLTRIKLDHHDPPRASTFTLAWCAPHSVPVAMGPRLVVCPHPALLPTPACLPPWHCVRTQGQMETLVVNE
ncbi:hypothetical protein E2C01_009897 [Portunus trituberculatus]|uniref:Uncharacterized protein n=1 Tax=Portunus trituberculatus TaxID=210409 RepID=A0A5B7D6Y0_PORTR|nr:hypothetical protein [Portunus trituberculatus]